MVSDELCGRAIAILRKCGPMRASDIGWQLWGEANVGGGEGSHAQNKFCRSAGKVLRELDRRGKVIDRIHGKARLWEAI